MLPAAAYQQSVRLYKLLMRELRRPRRNFSWARNAPQISRADVQEQATEGSAKPRRQACSTERGADSPGLGGAERRWRSSSADRAEGETPQPAYREIPKGYRDTLLARVIGTFGKGP